jgi:hypothetical protein
MSKIMLSSLLGAAFFLGLNAAAQPPATGYTQRDLQIQPPDAYQSGLALTRQVKMDIDRAEKNPEPNPGDHYRFATARGEIDRLQQNWQDGSYTRAQLNDAISHLQLVLDWNQLSPGSRDLLAADLERLRDFGVNHFN